MVEEFRIISITYEPIYKNMYNTIYIQYIIVYIIRLRLSLENTNKMLIGSWYIFELNGRDE